MGYYKNIQLERTSYCYFCQEEIRPDEEIIYLDIVTRIDGTKRSHISHPFHLDCAYEGDQRKGEE